MTYEIRGSKTLKESKEQLGFYQELGLSQRITIIRFSPPEGELDPIQLAKYEAARFSTEHKVKTFTSLGCEVNQHYLDYYTSPNEFQDLLKQANENSVGIIVQNPFAERSQTSLKQIDFEKDLDGMRLGNPYFPVSATSETIFRLVEPFIEDNDIVAVVGAKGFVGGGVIKLLEEKGVPVLGLDYGDDLLQTRNANIVVSATGVPELLDERHIIPEHRLVVDAGFVPLTDSPILGDVNRSAYDIPKSITPVPGGVGPFHMATLMERLVMQVTGKQIQRWDIPNPSKWPIYASAIGRGRVIQARIQKVVDAYQIGTSLDMRSDISMGKDFKEFTQELTSIQNWYEAAQQLGEEPEYLKEITDTELAFRQGQPLSPDKKLVMKRDKNHLAYNQLSADLDQGDSQAFLIRLATNAFKQGISSFRVKDILSFSPIIRDLEARKGERASQHYTGEIMREGWKTKNREQPPPPGQDRGPDIDRGPGLGW